MRALLLCRTGDDAGLAHRVDGERVVIGRAQDCQVSVLDDRLSRHHAQIFARAGSSWIEDLGSQLGTEVNRCRLQLGEEAPLVHFDVIRLGGEVELVWLELGRVPATEVLAAAIVGPGGERVPLRVGDNSLGASEENDLILPDPFVKQRHAVMTLSPRGLTLETVEDGTTFKVNGVTVAAVDLSHGDVVELSQTAEFKIELFTGAASIETPAVAALGSTTPPGAENVVPAPETQPPRAPEPEPDAEPEPEPAREAPSPPEAPAEPEARAVPEPVAATPEPTPAAASEPEAFDTKPMKAIVAPAVETASVPKPQSDTVTAPSGLPSAEATRLGHAPPSPSDSGAWRLNESRILPHAPVPAAHGESSAITAGVPIADLDEALKHARERHAALVAEASAEDTGSGRVAEIHSETLDLGASMHRPRIAHPPGIPPKDFKALRRETAVRIHVQAPGTETRATLLREGRHVVGRSETCRVVVSHPSVSREHAEIFVGPQGIRVRDLGSSNGTRKGSQRLADLNVPFGERLAFGDVLAWFEEL